jgi:hypothetical protein
MAPNFTDSRDSGGFAPCGSVARKGRARVPVYLVERYWPGVASEILHEQATVR